MDSSPFKICITTNVPHVLEKIFFSLDCESFKKCLQPPNHILSGSDVEWIRDPVQHHEKHVGGQLDDPCGVVQLESGGGVEAADEEVARERRVTAATAAHRGALLALEREALFSSPVIGLWGPYMANCTHRSCSSIIPR